MNYLSTIKDLDVLIAKHLIASGSANGQKFMNMIMILFQDYPGFVDICFKRFQFLTMRYLKVESLPKIMTTTRYNINSGSFWKDTIKKFASGEKVRFTDRQKGNTRLKLYMLGFLFGYYHVGYSEDRYESTGRRGNNKFNENRIDFKKLYTMQELRKIKMDLPNMWIITDESDKNGNPYYKPAERDDNSRGWFKRGIMVRRYESIEFTKIVRTGKEAETAEALFALLEIRT